MSLSLDFQQAHLDQVSRSFAFCIRRLPAPLREWVGLTYLVCRVLDTIEDADWADVGDQVWAFERFDEAIRDPRRAEGIRDWSARLPSTLTAGEKDLMRDAHLILAEFGRFPVAVQGPLREMVLSMSSGMRHFLSRKQAGLFQLKSLAEVNQYCFFVAGVVGEMLVRLVAHVEPRFPVSMTNLLKAHHFGLFLQKVNLLKDQLTDRNSGRDLVPSRDEVLKSARQNAQEAFEFLLVIPVDQREFRQFCAWSLFLGLESLAWVEKAYARGESTKVDRATAEQLIAAIDLRIDDNDALKDVFDQGMDLLGWATPEEVRASQSVPSLRPPNESGLDWLKRLYRGDLDAQSLNQLGLTEC